MFFNYMIAHIISKLLTKWPNNATSWGERYSKSADGEADCEEAPEIGDGGYTRKE